MFFDPGCDHRLFFPEKTKGWELQCTGLQRLGRAVTKLDHAWVAPGAGPPKYAKMPDLSGGSQAVDRRVASLLSVHPVDPPASFLFRVVQPAERINVGGAAHPALAVGRRVLDLFALLPDVGRRKVHDFSPAIAKSFHIR